MSETTEVKMRYVDIPKLQEAGNWACDYTFQFFVETIEQMVEEEGLQLNPAFQRGYVWSEEQQIAYIEFILSGGRTNKTVYLNNPSWSSGEIGAKSKYNDFVCVDGLQRITAVQRFVHNELKVFGCYYDEFDKTTKRRTFLRINVNSLPREKDVLQWYIEMNSGGVVHTEEEIERVKKMLETVE